MAGGAEHPAEDIGTVVRISDCRSAERAAGASSGKACSGIEARADGGAERDGDGAVIGAGTSTSLNAEGATKETSTGIRCGADRTTEGCVAASDQEQPHAGPTRCARLRCEAMRSMPGPPPWTRTMSFYNGVQNADLADTVLAWRLHAGADYAVNRRMSLRLRLTWSARGDMEDTGAYEVHPMQALDLAFTNTNAFRGSRRWTLMLAIRRGVGG